MDVSVECLRCGERHVLHQSPSRTVQDSECPRCGYLGWAETAKLTESARESLRRRSVELRRLRVVA